MKAKQFLSLTSRSLITLLVGFLIALGGLPILVSLAAPVPITADSFVAKAVEKTGDAVVRIDTEKVVSHRADPLFEDPFFREFFGDQFQSRYPTQERIRGQGSGFIVDPQGIILTNAHVVDQADQVSVTLKDGRTLPGKVMGTDPVTDLAVVKVDGQGENLPVAPLGDSEQVKVGDWAIAVGNPVGLNNTVTLGIISTLSRSSAQVGIPNKRVDFLQTDAAINPGNSGGPLLNAQGEVIGINTAIRADAMGIGFAIPINKAKELESLLAAGKEVPHPYIGVQMISLTPELARANNQDPNSPFLVPEVQGALVMRVLPDTPAQKAGLRVGDVIIKLNNRPITDGSQLQSLVEAAGVNQNLKLTIQRGAGQNQIELTVKTAQLQS